MRKELLIAIVVGFGLGLVIIFGIMTANQAVNKASTSVTQGTPEVTPTSTPLSQELLLTINSPQDNAISDKEKIEVSGQTDGGAIVVIVFTDGEKVIQADANGKFAGEITLAGGLNQIDVTAYDQNDNEVTKTINVVYSTSVI